MIQALRYGQDDLSADDSSIRQARDTLSDAQGSRDVDASIDCANAGSQEAQFPTNLPSPSIVRRFNTSDTHGLSGVVSLREAHTRLQNVLAAAAIILETSDVDAHDDREPDEPEQPHMTERNQNVSGSSPRVYTQQRARESSEDGSRVDDAVPNELLGPREVDDSIRIHPAAVSSFDIFERDLRAPSRPASPDAVAGSSDEYRRVQNIRRRLRLFGASIGIGLNTLTRSGSIGVGFNLDKVVLKRLMEPESVISDKEALDSSICRAAQLRRKFDVNPSQAILDDPDFWPNLSGSVNLSDWDGYCVEVVKFSLSNNNKAFVWMREGFEATIPEGRSRHIINSYQLAYRLLVGNGYVRAQDLIAAMAFYGPGDPSVDATGSRATRIFKEALSELDHHECAAVLREITGSTSLRISHTAPKIKVVWSSQLERDIDPRT